MPKKKENDARVPGERLKGEAARTLRCKQYRAINAKLGVGEPEVARVTHCATTVDGMLTAKVTRKLAKPKRGVPADRYPAPSYADCCNMALLEFLDSQGFDVANIMFNDDLRITHIPKKRGRS